MKNNRKRLASLFLVLMLIIATLAGCKDKVQDTGKNSEATVSPKATDESVATPEAELTYGPLDKNVRQDLTALELSYLMGNGTNLGNTMEAFGRTEIGTTADISAYETLWGQPVTTQEMITAMKEGGFDSIRIPVAWTNGMNYETGDYTIRKELLDRVEEIINYALNANMYVIINDHWDGGWWGMFGSATPETREKAMDLYTSMWTQIAERFKDYSDYLIFESANEELGSRLNDKDVASDSGTLTEDECYATTNLINQTFVDLIRKSGGNNEQRFLLIAGYNTDIFKTCDERYVMPTDSATSKLLLSVHYYTPWGYTGSASLSSWGTKKHYDEMNELFAMMTKFTDQGYGVVIGEYMVSYNEDGTVKDNTDDFFHNLLSNCDQYNFVPMLWDHTIMFLRSELKYVNEDIEEVFTDRSFTAQSSMTQEEEQASAKAAMAASLKAAEKRDAESEAPVIELTDDKSMAWIMFNSGDWNTMYSVGDTYDPGSITDGLVATDVEITGAGTYTVGLDFTGVSAGFANGVVFSALAIGNGEILYPGYVITVKELLINGEPYEMVGKPYTTSDNQICTRLNIYNGWVNKVPEEARTADGDVSNVVPSIVDPTTLGEIKSISMTFDYGPVQ